jgi:hypothetical protein
MPDQLSATEREAEAIRKVCNEYVAENGACGSSDWLLSRLLPIADRLAVTDVDGERPNFEIVTLPDGERVETTTASDQIAALEWFKDFTARAGRIDADNTHGYVLDDERVCFAARPLAPVRGVDDEERKQGHVYPGAPSAERPDGWTSDCSNGCGCWMGPARSGGPDGVDPFGPCPAARPVETEAKR